MLTKPPHIAVQTIAIPKLLYPWDEWKVEEAYQPADEKLMKRLDAVSFRGLVGLTLATAEWVVWRFEGFEETGRCFDFALDYVEAAWAGNVHMAYMRYIETDDDDWRGTARGPLNIAVTMIVDLMYDWRDHGRPSVYPAWMTNLALLVLPDTAKSAFENWQDGCIDRLLTYCPPGEDDPDEFFDESDEDPRGEPVPRELFDLTRDFDPADSSKLLDALLRGLDPEANPFLHSPDEMAEFEDWDGTPYQL